MATGNSKSSIVRSVVRNFSIMFGAQAVTWITSFVLLMFLPRYLGSEDYGRLYLALSVKLILGLFIDFGGNYLIMKEVARSTKIGKKILNSFFLLRIILWMISIGAVILFSELVGYSEHVYLLILILAVGKLFEGESKALKAYFQGIERTEYPSIGMVAERVFIAVVAVGALLLGADSLEIAVIYSLGMLLNLVILWQLSKKFIDLEITFDTKVFTLLKSGLPFFLFSLFSVIYYRVDAIMLSAMTTEKVTGWYGGAYRFFDMVMFLPIIYNQAVFPIFSKLWDNEEGTLEKTFGKSLKLILVMGIPVAIGIFIYSEEIVKFFMGLDEYGPSVVVLQMFSITIPLIYLDYTLGSALMGAANKEKHWAIVGFIAIFVNVGANFYLISYTQNLYGNGGMGAAIATFLTELFVMISAIYLLPDEYFKTFKSDYILKPIGAVIVMAFLIWIINGLNLYFMIEMLIAAIVYFVALIGLNTFPPEEIKLIKNLFSIQRLKVIFNNKN